MNQKLASERKRKKSTETNKRGSTTIKHQQQFTPKTHLISSFSCLSKIAMLGIQAFLISQLKPNHTVT